MRKKVTLSLDEDWLKLVDASRGYIPRSRYIEMIARDIGSTPPRSDEPGVPEAGRTPSGTEQLRSAAFRSATQ